MHSELQKQLSKKQLNMETKQVFTFMGLVLLAAVIPPKINLAQPDTVPKPTVADSVAILEQASSQYRKATAEITAENSEVAKSVHALAAVVPKKVTRVRKVEPQFVVKYQGEKTLARTTKYGVYRIFDMDEFLTARSLNTLRADVTPIEPTSRPVVKPIKKNLWQKLTSPFRRY